jgi:ParB-like chromosome segregation protein Spo0J
MKIIEENYDVPIIAVEREEDYYVLDGHHRAYISVKTRKKTIKSLILRFPRGSNYREVPKSSLEDMPIREIAPPSNVILAAWARILNILKHYEALYHMHFYMRREKILLRNLSPTEPELLKSQIKAINKLLVPITCVKREDKYYVLDGHARCLRARQLGLESIEAIVLFPQIPVNFGIVRTAKEMGLCKLDDIHVIG